MFEPIEALIDENDRRNSIAADNEEDELESEYHTLE